MKSRAADGRVHFHALRKMALSPAHYLAACAGEFVQTRAMIVGTVTHAKVFGACPAGRRVMQFPGEARRGKHWDAFVEAFSGDDTTIATGPEWEEGETIARAVLADPVAAPLLAGRFEVPLRWEMLGVPCATGGVDVLNAEDGYILDLKTTSCAQPERFQRHAVGLEYLAQVAWYVGGCIAALDWSPPRRYIVAVESSEPYAVTVHTVEDDALAFGQRQIATWLERLRVCEETNEWPGYVQAPVPFHAPVWAAPDEEDEESAA